MSDEPDEPKKPFRSMLDVARDATKHDLWATRGLAIQAYANLEQALCRLMAQLSGMRPDIAPIIFFKVVNTGARTGILEKLLKKKHGSAFNLFWNSFEAMLRVVDVQRNEIVHWNANVIEILKIPPEAVLKPPNHWSYDASTPSYSVDRIQEFIEKCAFLSGSCHNFSHLLAHLEEVPIDPEMEKLFQGDLFYPPRTTPDKLTGLLQTWHDICQQPITYPPPNTHPLYRTSIEPETLLLSSFWK